MVGDGQIEINEIHSFMPFALKRRVRGRRRWSMMDMREGDVGMMMMMMMMKQVLYITIYLVVKVDH